MKKFRAIFFLSVLLISQTGRFLLYEVQLWHIKKMVKQEIFQGVSEELCDVVVNNENIRWEEAGEEFCLNGEMYDVVTIKKQLGKTLIYCLNDGKEDQLLRKFADTFSFSAAREKDNGVPYTIKFHITDQYILSPCQAVSCIQLHRYYRRSVKSPLMPGIRETDIPPPRQTDLFTSL